MRIIFSDAVVANKPLPAQIDTKLSGSPDIDSLTFLSGTIFLSNAALNLTISNLEEIMITLLSSLY